MLYDFLKSNTKETEPTSPYDAVFFDLDGTLLAMDVPDFLERYFDQLRHCARDCGFNDAVMVDMVAIGFSAMGSHDPGVTNEQAFWQSAWEYLSHLLEKGEKHLPESLQALKALVATFYDDYFYQVGSHLPVMAEAEEVVATLDEAGYPLYLTTMPLFPVSAVRDRLAWAQVNPDHFTRITTWDNSTSVKPMHAYYRENLMAAGALDTPERVLMVGNNTRDDMACLGVGMDGFLVTNLLINDAYLDLQQLQHGTLADLLGYVRALPACNCSRARQGNPNACLLDCGCTPDRWERPGDREVSSVSAPGNLM